MPRLRLLFPHPTPTVAKRLDAGLGLLEKWLVREGRDHSVPSTIAAAIEHLQAAVADLKAQFELLPPASIPEAACTDS